ncbi:MAG: hypothetical protein J7M40_16600 [Planctomycetes bacterium]|nr:hypothetical protein [Planctomycetota bacterium]
MKRMQTVLVVLSVFVCMGCSCGPRQSGTGEPVFELVDYHVHLKGGLTLDEAVAISKKNGVKFGIAQNCGLGFPVTDDALWTKDRMQKVIDAAVKNDVAIEINARYRIPSEAFIKRAKTSGAKFAFGTNNTGRELGNLEYCRQMIAKCGLTAKDMFTPKPHDQKPIFKKGLPKK